MAEEDEDIEEAEEEGDDEESGGGGGGGKKKLLIIVAILLLLIIGGVAAAYFTGLADPVVEAIVGEHDTAAPEGPISFEGGVFYELPELLVNLNTGGRSQQFLKMRISIEIESEEMIPQVEQIMPRIVDSFQVYLRELRIEDLKGSAGLYRLREELLTRVNAAAVPVRVRDVLFREMLIQG